MSLNASLCGVSFLIIYIAHKVSLHISDRTENSNSCKGKRWRELVAGKAAAALLLLESCCSHWQTRSVIM